MGARRPRPVPRPLRRDGPPARGGDGPHHRAAGALNAPGGRGEDPGPVLLYDGACGFCGAAVRLVLRHDRRGTLRFAPLQGAYAEAVTARHPELAGVDALLWVETTVAGGPERVLSRSEAALRVAAYLGGRWRFALAARLLPRPLRDGLYDLVARHRHRLVTPPATCYVPPPEVHSRFLDQPDRGG